MAELARKTLSTLREFIDRVDDFVNAEYTLQTLIVPQKAEMKGVSKDTQRSSERKALEKAGPSQYDKKWEGRVPLQE